MTKLTVFATNLCFFERKAFDNMAYFVEKYAPWPHSDSSEVSQDWFGLKTRILVTLDDDKV